MANGRPGNPNWVKGVPGNPSGRPRVVADIQDLARQHGPEAIVTLVECLKDPKHSTISIPHRPPQTEAGSPAVTSLGGQFWTPIPRLRG